MGDTTTAQLTEHMKCTSPLSFDLLPFSRASFSLQNFHLWRRGLHFLPLLAVYDDFARLLPKPASHGDPFAEDAKDLNKVRCGCRGALLLGSYVSMHPLATL